MGTLTVYSKVNGRLVVARSELFTTTQQALRSQTLRCNDVYAPVREIRDRLWHLDGFASNAGEIRDSLAAYLRTN